MQGNWPRIVINRHDPGLSGGFTSIYFKPGEGPEIG